MDKGRPTVLITAVSDYLTSSTSLELGVLVQSIVSFDGIGARFVIAVPSRNSAHVKDFLNQKISQWDIQVVGINEGVQGSLASAVASLVSSDPGTGPLFIAAGDTEFSPGPFLEILRQIIQRPKSMGTVVFQSQDPRFSFLNLSEDGQINYVAEKRVVGKFATTGVFYFATTEIFLKAAEWCFVNKAVIGGNFYVSSTLNYALFQGESVDWLEIEKDQFKKHFAPLRAEE